MDTTFKATGSILIGRLAGLVRAQAYRLRGPMAVDAAHARQAELACIGAATRRDIGMSAQDATGISNYQPDLPFFMQAGFKPQE